MKKTTIIIILFLTTYSFSQEIFKIGDTIFYHKGTTTKNIHIADYFSVIKSVTQIEKDKEKFEMIGYKKLNDSIGYRLHSEYETNFPQIQTANGFQKFYHKNGKKSSEGIIKKGRSIGLWKHWYDNGQIMDERIIPENKPLSKEHKEYSLKNFWDKNGKQTIIDGNGYFELKKDSIITTGFYKNGVRHGKFSGVIKNRKYFDEYYKNGKMISGISWDAQGNKYKYKQVFNQPQYKDGEKSIANHIIKNFRIPKYAYDNNIYGRILVSFRIRKDGNMDEIRVTKSLCHECDQEALRVIKLLKKWKPASYRGQKVNIKYTLPIKYNL